MLSLMLEFVHSRNFLKRILSSFPLSSLVSLSIIPVLTLLATRLTVSHVPFIMETNIPGFAPGQPVVSTDIAIDYFLPLHEEPLLALASAQILSVV